ncbi:MAG: methyltransferase domain-containing protein [bacterium]|jgi:ubiquinone/menaquinone biosynthesis C-methylase UbiE/ABC-type transporter Mla subunit MlaD
MVKGLPEYRANRLDQFYDHAYFHGETSGYQKVGYEHDHADWKPLIHLICTHWKEHLRWLDVGCAYGYLLEQTDGLPVQSFGVDVSSYALHYLEKSDRRAQAMAEALPFQDHAFDVVSLFDLVEHLQNPLLVLQEVSRVLKPDGVVLLSTPDPIYFNRIEHSHISERPPSYWVDLLRKNGFQVTPRFGGEPYELELLATRGDRQQFQELTAHYLEQRYGENPNLHVSGDEIYLLPRQARQINFLQDGDWFYLLNPHLQPVEILVQLNAPCTNHPDFFLNDLKLRWRETRQTEEQLLHFWYPLRVPPGGHSLTVRMDDQPVCFTQLSIASQLINSRDFVSELAFDHYQRYELVREIIQAYSKDCRTILDVGGTFGFLPLFLPGYEITTLDVVWEDTPQSLHYDGEQLPFVDGAFDFVISVDTLEHIPQSQRERFLSQCCRVAKECVVVCGPFNEPEVARMESIVEDYLQVRYEREDRFLEEHALYTLPEKNEVRRLFEEQQLFVTELPNGYLPRWLLMQMVNNALSVAPELHQAKAHVNSLYNFHFASHDNCTPAYRYALIASREPFREDFLLTMNSLMSSDPVHDEYRGAVWNLTSLISSLAQFGLLKEKDQQILQQNERLQDLLEHLQNLEQTLGQEARQRDGLLHHTRNLEVMIHQNQEQFQSLEKHSGNLSKLIEELKKDRENFRHLYEEQRRHIENLEQRIQEKEQEIQSLQNHSANLLTLLEELKKDSWNVHQLNLELTKHSRNLEQQNQELNQHIMNLEQVMREKIQAQLTHSENLTKTLVHKENQLNELQKHSENLTLIINERDRQISNMQEHILHIDNHRGEVLKHAGNLEEIRRELEKSLQSLDGIFIAMVRSLNYSPRETREENLKIIQQSIDRLNGIYNSTVWQALSRLKLVPAKKDLS